MRKRFSIVHPYYNHQATLPLQMALWRTLSNEVELIVVDDHSDEPIDITGFDELKYPVKVVRVNDNIPWNVTGARNIGASLASGPYLILADFDCGVTPGMIKYLRPVVFGDKDILFPYLQTSANLKKYKPYGKLSRPHCNSFIIPTKFYREIGGYDEDFAGGWGYEDTYFHNYLAKYKGAVHINPEPPICFRYFVGHNHGEYAFGRLNEFGNAMLLKRKIDAKDYERGPGQTLRSTYTTLYEH